MPHLTPTVTVLVLFAGVLHATWNAIASRIEDPVLAFELIGGSESIVAAAVLIFAGLPAGPSIAFAAASAAIHVAYTGGLLWSYRLGDFGRAYPLARGSAPLLVAVGGWLLAGERLDAVQIGGVATIAGALLGLALADGRRGDTPRRAIYAALATGVTIAAYTVVDGLGVRRSGSPLAYLALLFVLEGPAIGAAAAVVRRARPQLRAGRAAADLRAGAIAGALSMAAYGIVIWAQTQGPLALVSALRETSVISGAVIATFVLGEPFARRRAWCAVAVATGIILISA